MADQCIVCLENLDVQSSPPAGLQLLPEDELQNSPSEDGLVAAAVLSASAQLPPKSPLRSTSDEDIHNQDIQGNIAVIQVCGHALHDACLREWTGKANSCPICRQAFHLVHVYDKVGGKLMHRRGYAPSQTGC